MFLQQSEKEGSKMRLNRTAFKEMRFKAVESVAEKLERTSLTGKKSDKKGGGEMKDFIVLTSLGPAAEYCGARLGVYDKGQP